MSTGSTAGAEGMLCSERRREYAVKHRLFCALCLLWGSIAASVILLARGA